MHWWNHYSSTQGSLNRSLWTWNFFLHFQSSLWTLATLRCHCGCYYFLHHIRKHLCSDGISYHLCCNLVCPCKILFLLIMCSGYSSSNWTCEYSQGCTVNTWLLHANQTHDRWSCNRWSCSLLWWYHIISYLLSGLRHDYDPFVTTIYARNDPVTLEEVYALLSS